MFPLAVALLAPAAALLVTDAGAQQPKGPPAGASASGSVAKPPIDKGPAGSTSGTVSNVGAPKLPPLAKAGPPPKAEDLWVAASTDDLIAQLEHRAIKEGLAGGRAAIGAIMAIPQLADEAKGGASRAALMRIAKALTEAKGDKNAKELGVEAATIARSIAPDAGAASGRIEDAKLGVVSAWRLVGPFKDTGGNGLDKAEGPEIAAAVEAPAAPPTKKKPDTAKPKKPDDDKPRPTSVELFRQLDTRWDDGAYDVAWRAVPAELVSARGVPLEALVYPRKESCSYLATVVTLPSDTQIVVHAAASGALRVMFDGAMLGSSDELHGLALADRIAAKVDATKGPHLLALKVCSGPAADAGRVRARVTNVDDDAVAGITFGDDLSKLPSSVNPPKFTALQTPLAKALSLPEKGTTVDDALSVALARRIGGADDLRSPRVQGFLDVVVNANPRPDVLALAGWLAPSRGNSTSWLNLAIERSAQNAVYEPVAKFARRTLVDGRLDAGYIDWAASTIGTSELQKANDLDAQILRARLLEGLGQEEASFAAWKTIWDANKESTPTAVLHQISGYQYGRPLVATAARAQAISIWPRESPRDLIRSKRILGAEAVKAATIASFRLISSGEEIESIAAELKDAGLVGEYRRFLLMATGWAPNRKAIWAELVQALAASPDAKDKELAKQALERARDLDPGSPFLRAEEDLAFGELHRDDEHYMPDPKTFLARKKGPAAGTTPNPKPEAGEPLLEVYDRELDWVRVVTVDDAGRVVQLIHYSREIVKAPKDASDLDEPHVPAEGDVVEVVRARVHRTDGTIAVPQQIDEGEGIGIRWTDLKPGDVVEVATRSFTEMPIGDRGAAPFYFMDYAGGPTTHPVLYNEVVIRSPKKHQLFTALVHEDAGKPDVHTTDLDPKSGRTVERYVWNNPIALPEEPLQPKASEIYPTIIGSQFKTWDDFVSWYKAGVGSFSTVDPRIKRQAEEIVKKAKAVSRDEKLAAIFNWIADQVKYVNYVSAEQWLPNRPQNVLDRLQGDCDDKAMLLITMLKAIGIEDAQEVLVQTRYTGMPSIITAKGAVAPMFDHGIAFLPGQNGKPDRYLDATSPESRLGPLPAMDARAAAIRVVFGGTTPIVTLPSSSPEEHGIDGTWTFAVGASGNAEIAIDETHSGDSAFWLRTSLKQQASSATWLEKYHSVATFPQIEVVPEGIDFKGELPQGKATLKFKAKSAALARKEGSDLVMSVHYGIPGVAQLAPLVKRVTPVVLPPHMAPSLDVVKAIITPPPGYKVAEMNVGGEVNGGPYGKASLTFEKGDKGTVVVKRTFSLDQSTIPVAEYDAWRGFLTKVDALFRREIRFVKGS
jgi:hypothetical protein